RQLSRRVSADRRPACGLYAEHDARVRRRHAPLGCEIQPDVAQYREPAARGRVARRRQLRAGAATAVASPCRARARSLGRNRARATRFERRAPMIAKRGLPCLLALLLAVAGCTGDVAEPEDRKSTRLNSSHVIISYAVFCLK